MKSHGNTVFIEAFRSCHCVTNLWIGIQGSLVGITLIVCFYHSHRWAQVFTEAATLEGRVSNVSGFLCSFNSIAHATVFRSISF